jgi:hypothetical protein
VQVDPNKTTLKAPGIKRVKLKFDKVLSSFAFKFKLRRFSMVADRVVRSPAAPGVDNDVEVEGYATELQHGGQFMPMAVMPGRALHSSTFQLNLSRFGHTSPCPPV